MLLHAAIAMLALIQAPDECRHGDTRSAQLSGARALQVEAGSGELRVEGRSGVDGVRVEARLCASSAELLENMRLETGVEGGTARVRTHQADRLDNDEYARIHLQIIVPEGMTAEVQDGSGEMRLSAIGDTRIVDGSGSIDASDMRGSLEMEDGSGGVTITDLSGTLTIADGSGELSLRNVQGTIDVHDGSGDIEIVEARSSVRIDDGSGSIEARGIGGDLIVGNDGSGSIRYSNVTGSVRIPAHKRQRNR